MSPFGQHRSVIQDHMDLVSYQNQAHAIGETLYAPIKVSVHRGAGELFLTPMHCVIRLSPNFSHPNDIIVRNPVMEQVAHRVHTDSPCFERPERLVQLLRYEPQIEILFERIAWCTPKSLRGCFRAAVLASWTGFSAAAKRFPSSVSHSILELIDMFLFPSDACVRLIELYCHSCENVP